MMASPKLRCVVPRDSAVSLAAYVSAAALAFKAQARRGTDLTHRSCRYYPYL